MPEVSLHRLRWQCRRGLLELDLLFEAFLESGYKKLSAAEKESFQELLLNSDQVLQQWMMGKTEPEERETAKLVRSIRQAT